MAESNEMLQQAVEAVRAGEQEKARQLLQDLVDQEPENVKAWLLMARVVENIDEKRICLTTVLQLDPNNEPAKKMLEQLESQAAKNRSDEEVYPGITRRLLTMVIAGCAIFTVVICALVLLVSSSVNGQRAAETASVEAVIRNATQTASALDAANTQIAAELTAEAVAAAQTALAINSPTPTVTSTRSVATLPPTNTATPEGSIETGPALLEAPPALGGSVITWGGRDILSNDFLELYLYDLAQAGRSPRQRVNDDAVQFPTIHPTGERVIYMQYDSSANDWSLFASNIDGQQEEALALRWQSVEFIRSPRMPRYSKDGNQVIFVGLAQDTQTNEIYILNLGTNELRRLTNDPANYSFPVMSPDLTRVIAVRVDPATSASDLVGIDLNSPNFAQTPITTDGAANIESSPDFSPDGTQMLYAVASGSNPDNRDIVLSFSDGRGAPIPVMANEDDEAYPFYSPDGTKVLFSSNRVGSYDLYVFELTTGNLWQLTADERDEFPGGWSPN